jgi:CNT family concentrative nucleoside transporter
MQRFTGLLGLSVIVLVAFLFSRNRKAIQPRIVAWGLGLQFLFAFLVLKTPVANAFTTLSEGMNHVLGYATEGSRFVFGDRLGAGTDNFGVILAFQVLPIIIFTASLFSVLYYVGVMQLFVRGMAMLMQRVMKTSGAETTSVAASIFMGNTEAPLTIRPFLADLTESELFTILVSGMAHIAGSVMAAYVLLAHLEFRHLLTAVIMTCPATLMLAKILIPETEKPVTAGDITIEIEKPGVNIIDAAARGASDGVMLALNVGGMLIAFISLVALVNGILGWAIPGLSMQSILGRLFAPVAWLLGVAWNDCATIGNLMGTRMVLNEFVAYSELGKLTMIDPHSKLIATYALCGFANLGTIAIAVGGMGALVPSRKSDIARLGFRAMLAGTMANFMTAAIAGVLL